MGFLDDRLDPDDEEKKKKKRGFLGRLLVDNPITQIHAAGINTALGFLQGGLETGEELGQQISREARGVAHAPPDEGSPHVLSEKVQGWREGFDRLVAPEDPGAGIVRAGARLVDTGAAYLGAGGRSIAQRALRGGMVDAAIPADETAVRAVEEYTGFEVPGSDSDAGAKAYEVGGGFLLGTSLDAFTTARAGARAVEDAYHASIKNPLAGLEEQALRGDESAGALAAENRSGLRERGERALPHLSGAASRTIKNLPTNLEKPQKLFDQGRAVPISRNFWGKYPLGKPQGFSEPLF